MDQYEPNVGVTEALGEHGTNPIVPRASGDTILLHNDDGTIREEWTVSGCEQRIKSQFEQWVRRRAKLMIAEADLEDGPEEANAMRTAFIAAYGAGHYNWSGRYCRSALGDHPGLVHLLYLLLRRCHPDVTEDDAARIFRENPRGGGMAIAWALGNSGGPQEGPKESSKPTKNGSTTKTNRKNPATMDD